MSSPAPARYNLVFYVGDRKWKDVPLTLKKPVTFGTAEKCNVRLGVSSDCGLLEEHACLESTDGQVYLRAFGPVKLNGNDVQGRVEYATGDKFHLGHKDKLILVLEKAAARSVNAPVSPRVVPTPSAINSPTKKGAKEKKKQASKKIEEEGEDSKEEKMEVEPTPKSTAKQSSEEASAEAIEEPAQSESTKASPNPKKQYGKKQKNHEGLYAGGRANVWAPLPVDTDTKSKSSRSSPAKKEEKKSPKPKEKAAPKSPKVAKEPNSPEQSSEDSEDKGVHRVLRPKDLPAAQIQVPRTIIYGGEKFIIPQKRSQAEVDKMSDADILLEAVTLAPGGILGDYKTYATRWYLGRHIGPAKETLFNLVNKGLLELDRGRYYGPDPEDKKNGDEGSAADEPEVTLLDSNSKKQEAATNSKKKKRKSDESDEEQPEVTKRAKSNATSASESDEK